MDKPKKRPLFKKEFNLEEKSNLEFKKDLNLDL